MDFFLNKVSQQAVSFAIRSGIVVTSNFAIRQCGRYISNVRGKDRMELLALQERLDTKIKIVSPAIDLVEIISARGNTSLESALILTKTLRADIQALGVRLADLTSEHGTDKKRVPSQDEIAFIKADINKLLAKIEDAVPFINLAIQTSGVTISTSIPHSVSPSRLLQASTLLSAGDTAYAMNPSEPSQIGMPFTLSLYMLFASHSHRQEQVSAKDLTWQEVIYKCRARLHRIPLFYEDADNADSLRARQKSDEFCYELVLVEDLDDGRAHDEEAPSSTYEEVKKAGIIARIPVHQISKMFYTTSGKLLGIDESNTPVLLIKRDKTTPPPRRLMENAEIYSYDESDDEDDKPYTLPTSPRRAPQNASPSATGGEYDLPRHLDQEWLAFGVFQETPDDTDSDAESVTSSSTLSNRPLTTSLNNLSLSPSTSRQVIPSPYLRPEVRSTLSILECLIRLCLLQNYQQTSHLAVSDELLNLFLSDAAWSGNREERRREREHAAEKIGFDPFDRTPERRQVREVRSAERERKRIVERPVMGKLETGREKRVEKVKVEREFKKEESERPMLAVSQAGAGEWTPERQLSM